MLPQTNAHGSLFGLACTLGPSHPRHNNQGQSKGAVIVFGFTGHCVVKLHDDGPVVLQFVTFIDFVPIHDGAFHSMTTFGMRKTFEGIVEVNSAACLTTTKLPPSLNETSTSVATQSNGLQST
jgi:hypothetical protein